MSLREEEPGERSEESADHHRGTRIDEKRCCDRHRSTRKQRHERRSIPDESNREPGHRGGEDHIEADRGGLWERRSRNPAGKGGKVPRNEDAEPRVPGTGKIDASEPCDVRAGQRECLVREQEGNAGADTFRERSCMRCDRGGVEEVPRVEKPDKQHDRAPRRTYREEPDEQTGHIQKVVIDSRDRTLSPSLNVMSASGQKVGSYIIPTRAHMVVADGEEVAAGTVLVKIPRDSGKTRDITGGLPRVTELFEARSPADPAIVSEIDGVVKFGDQKRGSREVFVRSHDGLDERRYLIPMGKHILSQENDVIRSGERLSDGAIDPHDILRIKGVGSVQEYLVNEIQEVTLNKVIERSGSWNGAGHVPVKIAMTCNPTHGWVKSRIYDKWETNTLPEGWVYIPAKLTDNPYLSPDYIESLKKNMPEYEYQVFVEGRWDVRLEGLLFDRTDLNTFSMDQVQGIEFDSVLAYIDVADEGDDYLCMIVGKVHDKRVYITDVIFTDKNIDVTMPLCTGLINKERVDFCRVETNNQGSVFIKMMRERVNPERILGVKNTTNKVTRILMQYAFIKEYVYFRNDIARGSEYDQFIRQVLGFMKDGTSKHDDAPDALAGLSKFISSMLPDRFV